jgi:hypothetical protein
MYKYCDSCGIPTSYFKVIDTKCICYECIEKVVEARMKTRTLSDHILDERCGKIADRICTDDALSD